MRHEKIRTELSCLRQDIKESLQDINKLQLEDILDELCIIRDDINFHISQVRKIIKKENKKNA